jgi:two-component system CheB/CheR fusion protein
MHSTSSSKPGNCRKPFELVAIAASAGGLKALTTILERLPATFPVPIAIAKHINPKHSSLLAEILKRRSQLVVKEVKTGERLQSGVAYLAPPNQHITIGADDRIVLSAFTSSSDFVCPSANLLFKSVARYYGARAIAVVLTGTGNDGAIGIQAISERGGITIAQNEVTSEFFGMPKAAIETKAVKYVLPLPEIPQILVELVTQGHTTQPVYRVQVEASMNPNEEAQALESLLEYLRQIRGFDFTGYKRSSLKRRIQKRMQVHNVTTFEAYLDYLQVHPEEFSILFNTILINVTGFFRDPDTWTHLRQQILPNLLAQKSQPSPVRVWSAGCASGEEAYSIAMLLIEQLGPEPFRDRVKIYATDLDEEALTQARQASYSTQDIECIPEDLRAKYFEPIGENRYTFCSDLRRVVIFGRHDLVRDAPISHLDLLVCRNTLMYFNAETQRRILARFHFALNNNGVLFLGKAEMLLAHTSLFTPLSLQHRIFNKVSQINIRDRLLVLAQTGDEEASEKLAVDERLREAAFNASPAAQIVVNHNSILVLANHSARTQFNLNQRDLGRPLQDLEISYRPVELRSRIDQVYRDRRGIVIPEVSRSLSDGRTQYLDIQVNPLTENSSGIIGVSITFNDITHTCQLQEQLKRSNHELETTNEELQSSNEELETTNEELQSTNEELETTNEELQSTNEELETMNEELQSTNEELQTINDELRQRTTDLNQANAFLNSVLTSLRSGVVVIDRNLNILSWNREAENLWGLRADEVNSQSILNLDIGLPVAKLRDSIHECLSGQCDRSELTLNATNRRGKAIQCRVSFTPLQGYEQERSGVILLMETFE